MSSAATAGRQQRKNDIPMSYSIHDMHTKINREMVESERAEVLVMSGTRYQIPGTVLLAHMKYVAAPLLVGRKWSSYRCMLHCASTVTGIPGTTPSDQMAPSIRCLCTDHRLIFITWIRDWEGPELGIFSAFAHPIIG